MGPRSPFGKQPALQCFFCEPAGRSWHVFRSRTDLANKLRAGQAVVLSIQSHPNPPSTLVQTSNPVCRKSAICNTAPLDPYLSPSNMAALVQGYPQQSGTVTVLQTRPSSASGMLQSVPVQTSTHYLPGGSHRNSLHGLPATVNAPVVYRGAQVPAQQYAFRGMPSFNPSLPTMPWQHARAHRTSSSPAVPTVQALDHLQPAVARSRYAASVSMTNLPSTADINMQMGPGTRDDSALPVPGTRRLATAQASRPPQPSNGTPSQPTLAAAAPSRVAPERYRRSALRADSTPSVTTVPQLRAAQLATLNRPISFVGPSSVSTLDDMGIAPAQSQAEIKRVRRRSMPALDSPGFPIHLTPHGFGRPAESIRPKSADMPAKTGNYLGTTDKSSKDEQTGAARNPGANARPSSVSPCNPHYCPFPAPRTLAHCPITCNALPFFRSTTDTEFFFLPFSPPTATANQPTPPRAPPWRRLIRPAPTLILPGT